MASQGVNKIAKNTFYLYVRQGISMLISFFTVNITLDVLGVTDYGINSVVAGTVSMFTFLTGAMAVGNQRFYAFYLGKDDYAKLKKIVGGTLAIYLSIIVVFLILGETVGLWILNNKLVIPEERIFAANWVFQLGLAGLCISLIQVPFVGLITAHEDMGVYAKMSILDSVLKLLYIYLLVIIPFDKLIIYAVLGLVVSLIGQTIYMWYCFKNYPESHVWPCFNKEIIKELLGFNIWNLCGNFAWVMKNQGTTMLLNVFFGPAINASQNIAGAVRGLSTTFSNGFTMALRPQVTKSYANGNHAHMFKLTFSGAKITYILMAVIVIPAIYNIAFILDLWLPEVPEYSVVFCQLMLIEILIDQVGGTLSTITQATGNIRNYQIWIGVFGTLNIPLSYVALRMGCSPEWVFVISIACQICVNGVRVVYLRKVRKNAVAECLKSMVLPCFIAAAIACGACCLMPQNTKIATVIPIVLTEIAIVVSTGYFIVLNHDEKTLVNTYINNLKSKFIYKKTRNENLKYKN